MLGPFDIAVWLVASLAEIAVLVCSLRSGLFRAYLSLNLYVLALAVSEILSLAVLLRYGFSSLQYTYFYFFSDAILILFKTAAVLGLYLHAFQEAHIVERIPYSYAIATIVATHHLFTVCGGDKTQVVCHRRRTRVLSNTVLRYCGVQLCALVHCAQAP